MSRLLAGCLWLFVSGLAWADDAADGAKLFEEHVHPILAKRCYSCHGPEKQESGLRLDSREALLKGGDSETPGAVVGKAAESLLMRAVRHEGELKMPPEEKMPDAEVAVLADWIAKGLPWGARTAAPVLSTEALVEKARRDHWSLQPIRRPALPTVKSPERAATPIDRFVLAKLDEAQLVPSDAADRRTLIRRLSFDLWGVPPTMAEVEEFLADDLPNAYERLVDRWLASPRYGERWGRHWLDVARYADTKGYAFANDRRYPYAYTYRDYVIRALNADKPYSEFILEQLAADQMDLGQDRERLAALGFLTTGRKFNNRQDDLDDQIDVVCRGLMGLTVGCARCHDHKYDPVPMEDYYSLYGVFASSEEPADLPLIAEPAQSAAFTAFQQELDKRKADLENYLNGKHGELVRQARERVANYLVRAVVDKPDSLLDKLPFLSADRNDVRMRLLERWRGYLRTRSKPEDPVFGPWSELMALSDSDFAAKGPGILEQTRAKPTGTQPQQVNPLLAARLAEQPPTSRAEVAHRYAQVLTAAYEKWKGAGENAEALGKLTPEERQLAEVLVSPNTPTDIARGDIGQFLNRAERNQQKELEKKIQAFQASSPAAPPRAMVLKESDRPFDPRVFLRGNPGRPGKPVPRQFLLVVSGPERKPFQKGGGRLELAQAIVSPENVLTRRVAANRLWLHHFGQSLIRNPADLGVRSDPPLQAELLEYLAARLLERDWSLKSLHREILMSNTYRQASLYRAEADAKDPENRLYWRMNRRRLEFEPLRDSLLAVGDELDGAIGGRPVDLLQAPYSRRRTIYGNIDRQDLPNLLRVFDFASPDQSQSERPRTTVPQQALFLMNSPLVIEQAGAVASRPEVTTASGVESQVVALYACVLQRRPASEELEAAKRFVSEVEGEGKSGLPPFTQLAQLLLLTNEFTYVD